MRASALLTALVLLACLRPPPAAAQGETDYRIGLSVGGISTVGLVVEARNGRGSVEMTVGTWSFRDVSVSVVRKQYIGGGRVQGVAGLGLWAVLAFPSDGRTGLALVARAPVGVEWQVDDGSHFLASEIGLNRGLWVRRTDPTDDTPMNNRIVPLPGASYRWRR